MNDLNELQLYLLNNYNIKVYINNARKINIIQNIKYIYLRLSLIIILSLIVFYTYLKYKYNILLLIVLIIIIIFYIQKYISMIYFYNKNDKLHEDISINYNDINFETGDIIQEVFNWNYECVYLLHLFPFDYLHNAFIIKFKNKNYILHYTNNNCGYPINMLSFNETKHIEICLLNEYFKDNYHSTKCYKLFKPNKKIDNNRVFKFLESLNMKKLQFSFLPCIKEDETTDYRFNCMTFILKILIELSIIKKFNIHNFSPNDLQYLPQMSNNFYKNPIFIKIK
jgi:hypothetical protein